MFEPLVVQTILARSGDGEHIRLHPKGRGHRYATCSPGNLPPPGNIFSDTWRLCWKCCTSRPSTGGENWPTSNVSCRVSAHPVTHEIVPLWSGWKRCGGKFVTCRCVQVWHVTNVPPQRKALPVKDSKARRSHKRLGCVSASQERDRRAPVAHAPASPGRKPFPATRIRTRDALSRLPFELIRPT